MFLDKLQQAFIILLPAQIYQILLKSKRTDFTASPYTIQKHYELYLITKILLFSECKVTKIFITVQYLIHGIFP